MAQELFTMVKQHSIFDAQQPVLSIDNVEGRPFPERWPETLRWSISSGKFRRYRKTDGGRQGMAHNTRLLLCSRRQSRVGHRVG